LQRARENLLNAYIEPEHDRDWRPQILAFSKDAHRRSMLLSFASWLEGKSGLTTVVKILEGKDVKMLRMREEAEKELRSDISTQGFDAFPLVIFGSDSEVALSTVIQSIGIGPLKANTILLNWLDPESKTHDAFRERYFTRNLKAAYGMGKNVVILGADQNKWQQFQNASVKKRRIDVWWWGGATSRLMLLFAYLITRNESWEDAEIRVLAAGYAKDSPEAMEDLKHSLNEARIEAEPIIITDIDTKKLFEYSSDATVVFLPFRLYGDLVDCLINAPMEEILSQLPLTAFVLAAEDIELDAEPEEGTAGEMAVAMDALNDAGKIAGEAEKKSIKAQKIAESARAKWLELGSKPISEEEKDRFLKLKSEANQADQEAKQALREAAKAKAQLEDAMKKVKNFKPDIDKKGA
jgi:hypothetical protein